MRRFWIWLVAIAAIGVAVRVVHTLTVAPWPPAGFGDELYYSLLGNLISSGHGFVHPGELLTHGRSVATAERPPLYPLLLGGLAELGGTSVDAQRLLGAVTGGGTIIVAGLLGRRLAGASAGLVAAGLTALYPTLIAADGALMTESLFGLLTGLALIGAYRLVDAPGVGRALVLGVILGLAALTRGEAFLLLPLLLVPLVRRPGGIRTAVVVCLTFAVVLTPWTIRNWTVFDRPVLVATETGETIGGANCDSTYHGDKLGRWDVFCVHQPEEGNEAERLNAVGRDGARYAGDHLGRLPVVLAARFGRTWSLYGTFAVPEGRSRTVTAIGVVAFFVLLPLAAYGFVLLRRRHVPVWILMSPFITVTLTTLVAYGALRFRQSAELPLAVLAAIALDRLFKARRAA
jgi:4-amino-4-deoxy-L-arabinose transferase-like glycosyltransferase